MAWKFVEGVTVADVAFTANAASLSELFKECGQAVGATMVKDLSSVKQANRVKLKLKAAGLEQLLHDFLEELVYYKDAKLLLFSGFDLQVDEEKLELTGTISGEKLDPKRHELLVDVKAVTWHQFSLEKKAGKWVATAVLDV